MCTCACAPMCVSSMSSCLFLFACHKLQVTWQAADAAPAVVEILMLTCLFPWAHGTNARERTLTHSHICKQKKLPTQKVGSRNMKTKTKTWNRTQARTELSRTEARPMRRMRNERLALAPQPRFIRAALTRLEICLHNRQKLLISCHLLKALHMRCGKTHCF